MGWTQSPPTFSVMSETVADLSNERFQSSPRICEPHRLESQANSPIRVGVIGWEFGDMPPVEPQGGRLRLPPPCRFILTQTRSQSQGRQVVPAGTGREGPVSAGVAQLLGGSDWGGECLAPRSQHAVL